MCIVCSGNNGVLFLVQTARAHQINFMLKIESEFMLIQMAEA